jgi:hypothetical protein
MTVQLYAEPTDSLCSLASPIVPKLDPTIFSKLSTAQGVYYVGKDVITNGKNWRDGTSF